MLEEKKKIELLEKYFSERSDVLMAFVFGSYAKGQIMSESDLDIAVYFKPRGKSIEWGESTIYPNEMEIWSDIEKITGIETDLVVLNRANPNIVFNVLKTGLPLSIKDPTIFLEFYLTISREAEDFRAFVKDYWLIYQRSRSLSEEDKVRLIKRLQFLDMEIQEFPNYQNLNLKTYQEDKIQRRNIERWIETLTIAAIDAAKIVLSSQKRKMPDSYGEALQSFALMADFTEKEAEEFGEFAKLRNILAHEYLDVRWKRIDDFIKRSEPYFRKLIEAVKSSFLAEKEKQ
ncbi:DUF86 domain-containing protein [Patescibacteria group bacterium]|nr:DUF86 domain-containing protein [Patescibacteria group bacterium]MBU4000352.1 DUF86 domain-containing protein [Patescibacteria group bacterium]MBU4056764.1 DUF86 domain-containing protein [Patescibacteria group bacterium]MBU4368789.1 DUF86 domain-containing protein [Patescibacteria group bacterium]